MITRILISLLKLVNIIRDKVKNTINIIAIINFNKFSY